MSNTGYGRKKAPYDPGFNGKIDNIRDALVWDPEDGIYDTTHTISYKPWTV